MTTKERIERVATRQFARYGFDGTSIRQIVAEARVTKPVLYYYFKDKRGLYLSLLGGAVAPLCDEVERVADGGGPPVKQLESIIVAFLRFYRERPNEFHLLHQAVERREREVQLIAQKYFRRIFLSISRVLSEGVDRKIFRSLHVSQTTFSVIAILVYYLTRAHVIDEVLGQKKASEDLMETLSQHVLGLLHT
ncbi:MAG: TetR/AcrR family transcriptional regulator [candidate division NC10 bacterium]|jgi:AcrR family transcriptional regulator|nr:TetR/AcrR family transcriptional regulator [candidate division NC10 bacterium]